MKLGFITSILENLSLELVVETAASIGYECIEAACWPHEKASRRYAGVTHIDIESLDGNRIQSIRDLCSRHGVEISALAYYPNTLTDDLEKREQAVTHLQKMIQAAPRLGVGTVTTFIGRIQTKTVEENLGSFPGSLDAADRMAEECGVKIAIENCPMLFGPDQWPAAEPHDHAGHLAQSF